MSVRWVEPPRRREANIECPTTVGTRVIGFASDRNGDWDIYVMDPTGNT